MHNNEWRKVVLHTGRLVFRMRFDCAFSSSDSDALERRLGSGLLLRHPQVSNQNSKEADTDTNQSDEKYSTVVNTSGKSFLVPSSFGLLFLSPPPPPQSTEQRATGLSMANQICCTT